MAAGDELDAGDEKAQRRVARKMIAAYHDEQLRLLLNHIRDGFAKFDAGEIDVFDLDEIIGHYKRSAAKLENFCGFSGGQWLRAARNLAYFREEGDEPDWWEAGTSRRDRQAASPAAQEAVVWGARIARPQERRRSPLKPLLSLSVVRDPCANEPEEGQIRRYRPA